MPKQAQTQQPNVDALQILKQAHCFFVARETLYAKVTADPKSSNELWRPAMVLSAFASELFLKALLAIETGKNPPQGHDLHFLFKKLSTATKRRLEEMWNWYAEGRKQVWDQFEKKMGSAIPRDLSGVLQAAAGSFEGLRYYYEPQD